MVSKVGWNRLKAREATIQSLVLAAGILFVVGRAGMATAERTRNTVHGTTASICHSKHLKNDMDGMPLLV